VPSGQVGDGPASVVVHWLRPAAGGKVPISVTVDRQSCNSGDEVVIHLPPRLAACRRCWPWVLAGRSTC